MCMYVCAYGVCMCACMYVVYVYVCLCVSVCMYVCAYGVCICVFVCMVYVYVCYVYVCMYTSSILFYFMSLELDKPYAMHT